MRTKLLTELHELVSKHGFVVYIAGADCHCKDEVELEEAIALARAMELSTEQSALPHVPGLSARRQEETITIHIQADQTVRSVCTLTLKVLICMHTCQFVHNVGIGLLKYGCNPLHAHMG